MPLGGSIQSQVLMLSIEDLEANVKNFLLVLLPPTPCPD